MLSVPEVTGRYYVLQFEDLFGTNVHYVGSRTTGTAAGTYLLRGAALGRQLPDGCDALLQFETDLVAVIGRSQLLGSGDAEALGTVMERCRLTPLSDLLGTETPPTTAFDWPIWNDEASRDERFVGYLNALLLLCQPTHPDEVELMARFAKIGIAPGEPFDPDAVDPDVRAALRAGVERARVAIADRAAHLGETTNGWSATEALGSRAFFAGDYLLRAAARWRDGAATTSWRRTTRSPGWTPTVARSTRPTTTG